MNLNREDILREKLKSTEFPFDPKAWEQMEAMLDKKTKRRGFIWWWPGGIAAALLLTTYLGFQLGKAYEDKFAHHSIGKHSEIFIEPALVSAANNGTNTIHEKAENVSKKTSSAAVTGAIENRHPSNSAEAGKPSQDKANKRKATRLISTKTPHAINPGSSLVSRSTPQSKGYATRSASLKKENPYRQEAQMLSEAAKHKSAIESILLIRKEAEAIVSFSESTYRGLEKLDDDVLPKNKRKKIFNYSCGLFANMSGSMVGKQTSPLFSSKPSYMIGFTHDFLFLNRVAISNSILFSQTSFNVKNAKTVSFDQAPLNYTSNITELNIPIGLKIYPVVEKNVRFYIGAGVINHIKLKETFNYKMQPDTNPSNIVVIPLNDPTSSFPEITDFSGAGYPYQKMNITGGLSTEQANTNDFSINSAKRYYASFYASAGVEYLIGKRFLVFAEPVFNMSLQTIGVQDKRTYNLGLNAGFRCIF